MGSFIAWDKRCVEIGHRKPPKDGPSFSETLLSHGVLGLRNDAVYAKHLSEEGLRTRLVHLCFDSWRATLRRTHSPGRIELGYLPVVQSFIGL